MQQDLFSSSNQFPSTWIYPHNESYEKVHQVWAKDYDKSSEILILTGFTSLEYLARFFENHPAQGKSSVRIVIGWEPETRPGKTIEQLSQHLDMRIKEYWLNEGFSILSSGAVINLIELLTSKQVQARIHHKLHAKILVSDDHVILGSSNFSLQGMNKQKEANVRIPRDVHEVEHLPNYTNVEKMANLFWDEASDYSQKLIELLKELLRLTTWKDALSRAIHELLDGEWVKNSYGFEERLQIDKMWPIQREGIGRALTLLEDQESLLIADPTGSGKTRMTAAIHYLFRLRRLLRNHMDGPQSLVIAPPSVQDSWKFEYNRIRFQDFNLVSQGVLSQPHGEATEDAYRFILQSDLLIIDEAHNYLNPHSKRSVSLLRAGSDNVILSTATPLNKRPEDLLRLVEILDPDNLNEKERAEFMELRKRKKGLDEEDKQKLKSFIQKFTLRRTKPTINAKISKDPEAYRNVRGDKCRYPEVEDIIYQMREPEDDCRLAMEVEEECRKLNGIINLESLKAHPWVLSSDEKQARYLDLRIKVAPALAQYKIQSLLRSSRAAAIEHIEGTNVAAQFAGLKGLKDKGSGNMLKKLGERLTLPPPSNLKIKLPTWLVDEFEWAQCREEEMGRYLKILNLIKQISGRREQAKAEQTVQILEDNPLCIGFDGSFISLHYYAKLMKDIDNSLDIKVVTGSDKNAQREAKSIFSIGSGAKRVAGLCTDSMSEGVNLQQASAVIFYDIPSVVRLAEQRIGRINRLDSPHERVKVFWPKDAESFGLKKDARLAEASNMVDKILGSNITIPDIFNRLADNEHVLSVDSFIEDQKKDRVKEEEFWKGVENAFSSVEGLIGEGGLISSEDYKQFTGVRQLTKCKLSIVDSSRPFVFSAIKGTERRAPKWIYFESGSENLITDINIICDKLRQQLPPLKEGDWDNKSAHLLSQMKSVVQRNEQKLLSNRKKRALRILGDLLRKLERLSVDGINSGQKPSLRMLRNVLENNPIEEQGSTPDLNELARRWLQMLQPIREKLMQPRRGQLITLDDVKKYFKKNPGDIPPIEQLLQNLPILDPPDRRLAACIVGVV